MKLENTRHIQADPGTVWENLVSVETLKQCIPGCQNMEQTGDNEYALTLKQKIGPVSATFKGELSLEDIVEGESYTLKFSGQGGAAGFSKGSAAVRLQPSGGGTDLVYAVDASIGGKIAQIGQRLVDGAARKMADDFFNNFEQVVAPAGEAESAAAPVASARPESAAGSRTWLWVGGGILLLLIIILLAG